MVEEGEPANTIRIALAEDHHVVRTAVASLLSRHAEFEVVGEIGEGGARLFDAVRKLEPDLLLLDAHMPGHDVIQDVKKLLEEYPKLKILVLSAYDRREYVLGLLKAGALGYVLKDDSSHMLLNAIRSVARGGEWVSPQVANVLLESVRHQEQSLAMNLTPRELEVLEALSSGAANSKIAEQLFITEQTVKNHVSSIFKKLGVETRVEAVLYAIRHGLVSPDERD
ncbi:MAG: LuxR C-terminal-related transcriptional regulator [Chloroflexota bacterium]